MDYFEQTSPNKYRFLDYYRHRQKQNDFTYSFREETDKLSCCLVSLVQKGTSEIKEAASRLQNCFEGHRTKYEDVNIFWQQVESEMSIDHAETKVACEIIYRSAGVVDTALTNVEEKMKQNRKCASVNKERFPKMNKYVTPTKESPSNTIPTLPHHKRMREDLQPNLVESVVSDYEDDEEQKEISESEESSDEESEIEMSENTLESFDKVDQLIESEWKLSSGELVKNVLSEKALSVFESCKNSKRLNAYQASVIRLGLSSIVDLSSEFQDGMSTWFGNEWADLKQKAQNQINMIPMKFEGSVLDSIVKIENLCLEYQYWEARDYLLGQMKDRSATKIHLQIVKIYFTILDTLLNDPYVFVDENNKETKLTEMEFVLKTVAPVMDIIFSDINHIVKLRWGETVSKVSSTCRKIDLKIETRGQCLELSHTECARAPTPAKIVRDRSKILRTNKCILDKYLRQNISGQAVEDSAVFALQFAGLYGQLLAVDLFDNGLYFGLEGPDFKFPSQLPNIKPLRQTLEVLYFFKECIIRKVTVLSQFDTQINPYKKVFHSVEEKQPEPKHKKIKFIRSTYFTPRGRNQK